MSTFEQAGSELHACNKTWNEAKAFSIWFHCQHLAVHHYISVYRISIVVINVGSLQPAICSGDKMSYIIASKCCDLEMILPCIFLKACAKHSGKLTLQGTFLSLRSLFLPFIPKFAVVLNSFPGKYKEMCWSLSLHNFFLFGVCLIFQFWGCFFFLAVGDRFDCHPFLSYAWCCLDFEWRVYSVPLGQCHSQEKIRCKPLLRHKTMHLFRMGEDMKESWDRIETVSGHKQVTWSCKIMED